MSRLTVGVDIGGTKIWAGVVNEDGEVRERVEELTPGRSVQPEVVEDSIVAAVGRLSGHRAVAVGVGAAGFVSADGSRVLFAPHLSWRDEPLRDRLQERIGLPVVVDNDANTTARAEVLCGAGRGFRQVLCLTLGTGIGGALVIDGRVFRGGNGLAGEFGHMQVVPDGRRCECGNRGCWEQYASGNALVREAHELVVNRSPAASVLRDLVDDDPSRLTGRLVMEAAQHGDHSAVEIFQTVGEWLGTGLAGLTAGFDPELIVVGGGVSDADSLLLEPARAALSRKLTGRGFRPVPPIVRAALGPDAGYIGAGLMAQEALSQER